MSGADFMPTAARHDSPHCQPIGSYLVILRQLIESETASDEPPGDDASQTDKSPAADDEDVGRLERNVGLLRAQVAALWWHRGERTFESLQEGMLDAEPHVLGDAIKTRHFTKTRYPEETGASMLLIVDHEPITEQKIQSMA
jgi:hypothetical protein